MEERPILMVLEIDVELLIPQHAAGAKNVDEFQEERVSHQVIDQHNCAYKSSVCPFCWIRISNVESTGGGIDNFIGCLWDCALDLFLIGIC